MSSPIDAALTQLGIGVSANMAPSPQLLRGGPDTAAAADTAAADLQNTDTTNAAAIGDVGSTAHPGDPVGGGEQMATLIPGLLGTMAGSLGGALGAAASALQQIPATMMGAVGPAMSALTGARAADTVSPGDTAIAADSPGYDPGLSASPGDTAIAGTPTSPAAGPLPTAVLPVTGASPTAPSVPPGAVTQTPTSTGSGSGFAPMPMGMPMSGGMGGSAATGTPESRSKKLQPTRTPHTEPVAGKTPEERIALPTKPRNEEPIVRRVTIPEVRGE